MQQVDCAKVHVYQRDTRHPRGFGTFVRATNPRPAGIALMVKVSCFDDLPAVKVFRSRR